MANNRHLHGIGRIIVVGALGLSSLLIGNGCSTTPENIKRCEVHFTNETSLDLDSGGVYDGITGKYLGQYKGDLNYQRQKYFENERKRERDGNEAWAAALQGALEFNRRGGY